MRIILDENVPRPVAEWLRGHEVTTVQEKGWSGVENGELLARLAGNFDLFITADKNLRYQQDLRELPIAILELPFNRLPDLLAIKTRVMQAVNEIKPRVYHRL
jgi:hypothetical protein